MTYLAAFYVGTIIKDTAALVEPRVLPTFHRVFSLWIHPELPFYCCTHHILYLVAASLLELGWPGRSRLCAVPFAGFSRRSSWLWEGTVGIHHSGFNQMRLISSGSSGRQHKLGLLGFIPELLPVLSSSNSIIYWTSFKFWAKISGFKSVTQLADLRHSSGCKKVWN